jgi:hypothetical protein
VFIVLTVAVIAAALNVNGLHNWYTSKFGGGDAGSGTGTAQAAPPKPVATQAPESAKPTAAPSTEAPQTPTVAHPWAGSPAEAWPAGADAIVLPEAKATGVFGQDAVQSRLALVKQFLVAANLDQSVVNGGATQPVLDLVNSKEREQLSSALAHPDNDHDPTSWISRFDSRTAVPAVPEIKLQGRIAFEEDEKGGLLVHTDYSFVYAVVPGPEQYHPAAPSGGAAQSVSLYQLSPTAVVTREIVRRVQDFRFYDPKHFKVETDKLYLGEGHSNMAGNHCEMGDGWLQPDFPETRPGDQSPDSGATVDPYDRSKDLPPLDGKCDHVSRT